MNQVKRTGGIRNRTTQRLTGVPWYRYTEQHMNEHMAEHPTVSKSSAFTGFDLELCYLLNYKTIDFQTICQNRIIKCLYQQSNRGIDKELGEVKTFKSVHDDKIVHHSLLGYQAQNLVYMYALGLIDVLDEELITTTNDVVVKNGYRRNNDIGILDSILPIFESVIGMEDEISLDNLETVRKKYASKRPLADEIVLQGKLCKLKLQDTLIYDPSDIMSGVYLK